MEDDSKSMLGLWLEFWKFMELRPCPAVDRPSGRSTVGAQFSEDRVCRPTAVDRHLSGGRPTRGEFGLFEEGSTHCVDVSTQICFRSTGALGGRPTL